MVQVRAQVESQVDAMLAEFNAEKALKEKEKETEEKEKEKEKSKTEENTKAAEAGAKQEEVEDEEHTKEHGGEQGEPATRSAGVAAGGASLAAAAPAREAGGGGGAGAGGKAGAAAAAAAGRGKGHLHHTEAMRVGTTGAAGEKKAKLAPKHLQHASAMRAKHEAADVEGKPGAAAGENTAAAVRAPDGGEGSEESRSRSASEASSVGLSELLRESDKSGKDSDVGASGAFPDEEDEKDIKLPSPKISISAGARAEQGQGQTGQGGDGDDNSEPPSLPTSMQSTPKAASTRGMSVDEILHPSQALALGGQTAKDLKGLDKLLAKAAPSQDGGKDEESDWDLDMSSQVSSICQPLSPLPHAAVSARMPRLSAVQVVGAAAGGPRARALLPLRRVCCRGRRSRRGLRCLRPRRAQQRPWRHTGEPPRRFSSLRIVRHKRPRLRRQGAPCRIRLCPPGTRPRRLPPKLALVAPRHQRGLTGMRSRRLCPRSGPLPNVARARRRQQAGRWRWGRRQQQQLVGMSLPTGTSRLPPRSTRARSGGGIALTLPTPTPARTTSC